MMPIDINIDGDDYRLVAARPGPGVVADPPQQREVLPLRRHALAERLQQVQRPGAEEVRRPALHNLPPDPFRDRAQVSWRLRVLAPRPPNRT